MALKKRLKDLPEKIQVRIRKQQLILLLISAILIIFYILKFTNLINAEQFDLYSNIYVAAVLGIYGLVFLIKREIFWYYISLVSGYEYSLLKGRIVYFVALMYFLGSGILIASIYK